MEQVQTWDKMRAWCEELLVRKTGEDVAAWNRRMAEHQFADEAALREWLTEQGVTGYARMLLLMERFGYPDFLLASADQLIDGQYADRPDLRPILEAVVAAVQTLGPVTIQARKTYVSLVTPKRTFAIVKATTRKRVDVGLRIDGQEPEGRLLDGKAVGNDNYRLRLALASPEELDGEALGWLQRAYLANGGVAE